jgi:hypothetical protein
MPTRLHYAQSWEDPRLIQHLWTRHPADHHHLIASGGDHALELALRGFSNLHLYDLESAQLTHIQSKIQALNLREADRNKAFGYRKGRRGLLHDGQLERFLGFFARTLVPLLVPPTTRELLRNAYHTDAQLAIWDGPWQTARWRWVAQRYFEPKRVDDSARHPGLTAESGRTKQPINYLNQFRDKLATFTLADNHFAEYPLYGQYRTSGIPYLDEGLCGTPLRHLHLHHQSLESALGTSEPGLRGIHASDILEGRSTSEVALFFHTVDRASAPGSTLIFWDHRFRTEFPEWWLQTWTRVTDLPPDRVPFYHQVHAFIKS